MTGDRRKPGPFLKSFVWAFSGIGQAFKSERNLHVQSSVGFIVIVVSIYLHISLSDWIHVSLLIGGVISLELVNTAIERVVDLVTEDKHPLAKAAKDIAAGAVLFFSITSVVISFLIFLKYIL
ncbi:diacylglycerol kinase family protein [Pullulanibacillus sp. KACC 23026]|uniref:diacylglycerol kinase family protein n=1 Tax=Pullulanibacillus sp. KACC 23026 TaxID=3028315 RepID=UPI0023AEEA05|nr:diacylglycerol kinase family protein [Pullulanibacillus sp. KACC 23026]WEG14238.1 diacylglycerol kinase family protein [Pullulanibacillus sp. KACC 23026]